MKPLAIAAAALLTACTTHTQREMRAANTAMEATWKSATAGDWGGANSKASTIPGHVRSGVEGRPVRKVNGAELDLLPILAGWEKHAAPPLLAAVRSKDPARLDSAFRFSLTQCTACHTAVGKPESEVFQIPTRQ